MSTNPEILFINLDTDTEELRPMSDFEYQEYLTLEEESTKILEKKQQTIVNKEIAIGKLVALGLTEEDIKAMGI